MTTIFSSPFGFLFLLAPFLFGMVGSLVLRKDDALANAWSSVCAVVGSLLGIFFSVSLFTSGHDLSFFAVQSIFPLLSFSFHIDKLAAFFIFIISLITLFSSIYAFGYVKHFYKKYNIGDLGFFYHLFILGMLFVVSASNGIFFLVAWEVMSVASYFLVVYDRNNEANLKAGFLYLVMTHIGTVFIIVAFLLLYKVTGSFEFEAIKAGAYLIPSSVKDVIFVLAMIGFGTKAGIIPFHIWLPAAHPAAPSHVSALMSGVMIKTGIFMMIRLFLDILAPVPLWWGIAVLISGAVSSLLGVLYALTEHDIKRLLAYHSIENIGIILLGLGSALVFSSLGLPSLALLGLVAALFHTLNHATFKSLLFLSAGSVINQTHTRNMEEYGGLIKKMPQTALFFLIGSMAISALPPFNGFFSEWLTFQSLFWGVASSDLAVKWTFILAIGALAFTGGLALACFVKAFGATFLARPRSEEATHARESSSSLLFGMGALAVTTLVLGLFSKFVATVLELVGKDLGAFRNVSFPTPLSEGPGLIVGNGISSVSGLAIFALFLVVSFLIVIIVKFAVNWRQKITIGSTWDCGTELRPRMEITATGFARSIILIFKGILKPSIQHDVEYHDSESRYLPKSRTVLLGTSDIHHSYFYQPLSATMDWLAFQSKKIQNGNASTYITYIFIALFIALFSIL